MLDYIKKNIKSVLIYTAFGFFIYVLALYLSFPYEKISARLIKNIEKQYDITLKIGSVSPRLLIGFKAEKIELSGRTLTSGKPLNFNSLKVSIPTLGLILYPFTRSISYNFSAIIQKGSLKGFIRTSKTGVDIALGAKSLNLESVAPLFANTGILISGTADGRLLTTIDKKDFANYSLLKGRGELSLNTVNLSIQSQPPASGSTEESYQTTSSSFMTFLAAMPISFSKLESKIVLNNGILEIKDLSIEREGLTGKITGVVKLESYFQNSILDISLNLKLASDEKLLRPLLSLYGGTIGCPLNPDNTVSCKIRKSIRELTTPY